jgi:hypothetical protein
LVKSFAQSVFLALHKKDDLGKNRKLASTSTKV